MGVAVPVNPTRPPCGNVKIPEYVIEYEKLFFNDELTTKLVVVKPSSKNGLTSSQTSNIMVRYNFKELDALVDGIRDDDDDDDDVRHNNNEENVDDDGGDDDDDGNKESKERLNEIFIKKKREEKNVSAPNRNNNNGGNNDVGIDDKR